MKAPTIVSTCILIASVFAATGCGFFTAGVATSSGGGGGGKNTAPTFSAFEIDGFALDQPKESPARIRLAVADRESDPATVELALVLPSDPGVEHPLTAIPENPVTLTTSPVGTMHSIPWDFVLEPGLPADGSYVEGVRLVANARGGAAGQLVFGLGNDAPVVTLVAPLPTDPSAPEESSGIVEVRIGVFDSSSDAVDVLVEWQRVDDPTGTWNPATATGVFPEGVETTPAGVELSFFWNTSVDLEDEEAEVLLRVSADDRIAVGDPLVAGAALRIDNNAEPLVQLANDSVVGSTDTRRGIPVPFRLRDEEGDLVEVIFQWSPFGEPFPSLPVDPVQLDRLLDDPELRTAARICSPFPRHASGRLVRVDSRVVRLPELREASDWTLSELEGDRLEVLRGNPLPAPIASSWGANPLEHPVAALPLGDGRTALVLDAPSGEGRLRQVRGRLRELELATGRVVRSLAELRPGVPAALALERGEAAALVATVAPGLWWIDRVELASGKISELAFSDPSRPGPVRGIASLAPGKAAFTAGSELLGLDYEDPLGARVSTLVPGLHGPSGVVCDPMREGWLYVAERDAPRTDGVGRIVELDLDVRAPLALPAIVERPGSLALTHGGLRILAVTQPAEGPRLVGLEVSGLETATAFPIGPTRADGLEAIACGPDGLVVVTQPGADELLVGGGVEQVHEVVAYDPAGSEVAVRDAFDPPLTTGQPWRLSSGDRFLIRAARGRETPGTFLWDSAEVGEGPIVVRAVARDAELGPLATGLVPKVIAPPFGDEVASLAVDAKLQAYVRGPAWALRDIDGDSRLDVVWPGFGGIGVYYQNEPLDFSRRKRVSDSRSIALVAADLDGDGDLDVASSIGQPEPGIAISFQAAPRFFASEPLLLTAPDIRPGSLHAADLDGDGDVDLVANDLVAQDLLLFLQTAPGEFGSAPLHLGGPGITDGASQPKSGDVDADGDLDLVAVNFSSSTIAVFLNDGEGRFDASPIVLGGPGVSDRMADPTVVDLDADGDLDVLCPSTEQPGVLLFLQQPGGDFAPPLLLEVGDLCWSAAVADLDGDGDLDIACTEDTGAAVFFQRSRGVFDPEPFRIRGAESGLIRGTPSVEAADVNGDGRVDLVVTSEDAGAGIVRFFLQDAPGSFGTEATITEIFAFQVPATDDIDGDGDRDLIIPSDEGVVILRQLAPRVFDTNPIPVGRPVGPSVFFTADLDGDGSRDLVTKEFRDGFLRIYFQTEPGSFAEEAREVGGSFLEDHVVAAADDLDQDGDLDLVSFSDGQVIVFHQVARGMFDPVPQALGKAGFAVQGIVGVDLDGDGDRDLAIAESFGVRLYFQEPGWPFVSEPPLVPLPGFEQMVVQDLDADGLVDLVRASGPRVYVSFQIEPGTFESTPVQFSFDSFGGVPAITDLDGDGDPDLVFGGESLLQSRPRTFVPGPTSRVTTSSRQALLDLDGDGELDLLKATFGVQVNWGGP